MPILVYHKIALRSKDNLTVSIYNFIKHLFFLKGKEVVYLQDYSPNKKTQYVLRFDDGYKSIKHFVAPLMKLFGFPYEIFIVDNFYRNALLGNKVWCNKQDLEYIIKSGGRLQYHSKSHPDLTKQTEDLPAELLVPQDLRNLDKKGFTFFAYPFWKYNQIVINEVQKHYIGALSGNGFGDDSTYALNGIKMDNDTKLNKETID